jgi:hypothetical protein
VIAGCHRHQGGPRPTRSVPGPRRHRLLCHAVAEATKPIETAGDVIVGPKITMPGQHLEQVIHAAARVSFCACSLFTERSYHPVVPSWPRSALIGPLFSRSHPPSFLLFYLIVILPQVSVVMKFGGSSVASAERMWEVAQIVTSFPDQFPCVVLSAMGKVSSSA